MPTWRIVAYNAWHIIANALRVCMLWPCHHSRPAAFAQEDAARAAYEREDYAAAVALYAPRAAQGDADAQYRMGMMARFGWGMDKDTAAAVRCLTQAARQNQPQAQAELGTMYRLGRGVPEDPKEAARWLTAAARRAWALRSFDRPHVPRRRRRRARPR